MGAQIVHLMIEQKECPICGAKPGETKYDLGENKRMIIVGNGVEITVNKGGDYIARRTEDDK